ncbi:Metallo-dependent phosphatase-like protein [Dendryphion nanum]|uniref:Metallo-dependent phosphatase-like protein n=1 Tax=Dendryphion nanum TaxID=256645 RepID=A0A9P9DS08_9PLEO|nr:Metallo-dependent phosphatase-like protein [Dendryphion nanum]
MAIGTQFLIISDTHGHWPYNETNPAPKVDVLVHCGDLTQIGGLPSSRKAIAQLKSIDAEIRLVIAGNHDIELDQQWLFASPYTPEFNGYAFAYGHMEDRFTHVPGDLDLMITHGPPAFDDPVYKLDINGKEDHCGCQKLCQAIQCAKPRLHCFGHLHEGRGVARIGWNEKNPSITPLGKTVKLHIGLDTSTRHRDTFLLNAALRDTKDEGVFITMDLPT